MCGHQLSEAAVVTRSFRVTGEFMAICTRDIADGVQGVMKGFLCRWPKTAGVVLSEACGACLVVRVDDGRSKWRVECGVFSRHARR